MKREDFLVEGSDYRQSYEKISGKKVKDIHGYVSREFDSATFKISCILFDDGTTQDVEGEHDFPYIVGYSNELEEKLEEIYELDSDE